MRIAVNLKPYFKGKIGGMENYVRHVVGGIARYQRSANSDWTVFAHVSEVENVREIADGATIIPVTHDTGSAVARQELERHQYDLLFCPLLVMDPLLAMDTPCVVTVPDLQHEFLPEFFDENILNWRKATFGPSVRYADAVFTISEYSKSTIVEKFGVNPGKVIVVGLDVDAEFRTASTPQLQASFRALNLPEQYIYYPANFWKHKNHSTLLRALKLLIRSGYPNLHLVVTGAPGDDMERVRAEVGELGLTGHVRFLGYQLRAILPEIYRHASALTFVSRFEGFGIPILEAFHSAVPVVTSKTTSCPEVAGSAAVFVDETSAEDIVRGIRLVFENGDCRRQLIQMGEDRARQYAWEETIKTSLQVFETVARRERRVSRLEVHEYPVVSVITPTYNMAHFLEETIQSVLAQDYPHIDYVVMDGGSRDGTVELLQKYYGRLRYVSAPDEGQADAINRGFDLSHGKVFAFLNADDTYLPGALGTAVNAMRAHAGVGAVYGDAYYVYEDGSRMGTYPTRPFDFEDLSRNCFICQPAAFMWRDAFVAAGGMNKHLHLALDYDLWIRLGKRFSLKKIDGYLATSRMYRNNKTVSKRKQVYEEIIQVVKEHYGYVPYDWVYGYAAYLIDRKDQIFELSRQSATKQILALLLGIYYNPGKRFKYWKDWQTALGIGDTFTDRWEDGWISSEYDHTVEGTRDCDCIVISGRHLAPFKNGLNLSISVNGVLMKKVSIRAAGPFKVEVPCLDMASGRMRLKIESKSTFRPLKGGDTRQLSCIIDSITTERLRNQTL